MKSFLWRMRSNVGWFVAAMALFAAVYAWWVSFNVRYRTMGGTTQIIADCLSGISPIVISYIVCLSFFFLSAKRYSADEEYLYGHSRRYAYVAAYLSSAVYAVLFALYALGAALFARRSVLSAPDMAVTTDVYDIAGWELAANLAYLVLINLIAYESANLLRKFRSWKFWLTVIVCGGVLLLLAVVFLFSRQTGVTQESHFWPQMFSVFGPLLAVMTACDLYMTRGRQYR